MSLILKTTRNNEKMESEKGFMMFYHFIIYFLKLHRKKLHQKKFKKKASQGPVILLAETR